MRKKPHRHFERKTGELKTSQENVPPNDEEKITTTLEEKKKITVLLRTNGRRKKYAEQELKNENGEKELKICHADKKKRIEIETVKVHDSVHFK